MSRRHVPAPDEAAQSALEGDLHAAWADFSRLVQTLVLRAMTS
jgi:hypothetical protein